MTPGPISDKSTPGQARGLFIPSQGDRLQLVDRQITERLYELDDNYCESKNNE